MSLLLPSDIQHLIIHYASKSDPTWSSNRDKLILSSYNPQHQHILSQLHSSTTIPWFYISVVCPDGQTVRWGYLQTVKYLSYNDKTNAKYSSSGGIIMFLDRTEMCVDQLPLPFYNKYRPGDCDWTLSIYRAPPSPSKELTLPTCVRVLKDRFAFYCGLSSSYPITSLEEDQLSFYLMSCAVQSETALPNFIEHETRLFLHRLDTCLSTGTHLLSIFNDAHDATGIVDSQTILTDIQLQSVYGWCPRKLIKFPFEVAGSLLSKKRIFVYHGNVYLHIGQVYSILKTIAKDKLTQIVNINHRHRQVHPSLVERMNPYFRLMNKWILLNHASGSAGAPGMRTGVMTRPPSAYSTIDRFMPMCITKMKASLLKKKSSEGGLYLDNQSRTILILALLAAHVPKQEILKHLKRRVEVVYEKQQQQAELRSAEEQVRFLETKKKTYNYSCGSVGRAGWCNQTQAIACVSTCRERFQSKHPSTPITYIRGPTHYIQFAI